MARGINGIALGTAIAGAAFLYSGVSGAGLSKTVRGFIAGDLPSIQGFDISDSSGAGGSGTGDGSGVVALAQKQLGKKYVWDTPLSWHTKNPPTFDCSGLSGWCYFNALKVNLPHEASAQYDKLSHGPLSGAAPGDLVFYQNGSDIYHVAIYIGNGTIIEAPEAGIPVRTRAIKSTDADIMQVVGKVPGGTAASGKVGKGGNPAANKQIGRVLAAGYGWTGNQFADLDKLWTRESGWSNTAKNPSSGAYGIAQALPQSKYPAAGQESGGSDAATQIRWGLKYIKSRYGSPSAAWAHETANSWY